MKFRKIQAATLFSCLALSSTSLYAFENVAYVETNSNALSNVACFVDSQTQKPFFDTAVIFALNVDGSDPNNAQISINSQDHTLLTQTNEIQALQSQGIKVVAAILGNHQYAGWSTVSTQAGAENFAKAVSQVVNQYGFNGIAIDDEYTKENTDNPFNPNSTLMIVKALSQLKDFHGKSIQYVLLPLNGGEVNRQAEILNAKDMNGKRLSAYLTSATPGFYTDNTTSVSLEPYKAYGFSSEQLYLSVASPSADSSDQLTNEAISQAGIIEAHRVMPEGWGGFMVYNLNINSFDFLRQAYTNLYPNSSLSLKPHCLR